MFLRDQEISDAYKKMANCGCDEELKGITISTNEMMEWFTIRCSRCHKDTGPQPSLKKAVLVWNTDTVH